ncbi:hypothetical protein ACH5RR_021699 [Cinchona calisaya]|uniref:feruloyl-CoA 6-hydroxylase n=1 Tax=Cinchona calisaya TaxID=153742 RepID=A0ABD2ZI17_9GENT
MAASFEDGNSLFDFVVKDGNGIKGLVDSGIVKVPEIFVHPLDERIEKVDEKGSKEHFLTVPIDLSKLDGPDHDQVVNDIVTSAKTLGFFQAINHGMSLDLLESLKDAAHQFFAQPPEAKAVYRRGVSRSPLVTYYTSFSAEKDKPLEWRDYDSMVYTTDGDALEHWPKECKEVALDYMKLSAKMIRRLVEILVGSLGVNLEDSKLESLIGKKVVNMNFYPNCPNPELTVGAGRHSDMGTITVLLQDDVGGLQIRVEEDIVAGRKEEWIEIPTIPGALVVNLGDALQILSNGRYRSAEHRVRTTSKQPRVSIPAFCSPTPTAKIGPLPQQVELDGGPLYHEAIFKDYMALFFGNAHDGKKCLDFAKISTI